MSKRIGVNEARVMSNFGEIKDVEAVSTETVRKIVEVLRGSNLRNCDNQTALCEAEAELEFRTRNGY